jgi:hypothetical protein
MDNTSTDLTYGLRNKTSINSVDADVELKKRKEFSDREVGITHPDLQSFIRLNDQGDIEIFASPGVGIIISSRSKSISIFGDSIRFFTKDDGLRWNSYNFNYAASNYIEPTLVKVNPKTIHSANNKVSYYLDLLKDYEDKEDQNTVTINSEYGFNPDNDVPSQTLIPENDFTGLTTEQIGLIEAYSTDYPKEHIDLIIKFLKEGLNFNQAHERALRETNV